MGGAAVYFVLMITSSSTASACHCHRRSSSMRTTALLLVLVLRLHSTTGKFSGGRCSQHLILVPVVHAVILHIDHRCHRRLGRCIPHITRRSAAAYGQDRCVGIVTATAALEQQRCLVRPRQRTGQFAIVAIETHLMHTGDQRSILALRVKMIRRHVLTGGSYADEALYLRRTYMYRFIKLS
uniref:Putative secreted protein n=1 Tax=Anopheles darlingi TaxID=43151 RepID=A0A2M4DET4_ANODA